MKKDYVMRGHLLLQFGLLAQLLQEASIFLRDLALTFRREISSEVSAIIFSRCAASVFSGSASSSASSRPA
jgi:hypothetical protein